MYEFHYNDMKPLFGKDIHLLYTDTDSLLYEIKNHVNPYSKIFHTHQECRFDLSNFPVTHPLYDVSRKQLPGAFKDKCNELYIRELVGLHSKMHILLFDNDSKVSRAESKVVKGSVIRMSVAFKDYIHCLHSDETMEHTFKMIRSVSRDVHTLEQSKVSFDDKRYRLDTVHSVPYGHFMIQYC